MKKFIRVFFGLVVLIFAAGGWAADIYVSPAGGGTGTAPGDPTDLQAALDTARTNGEDDMIYLKTGTYDASLSGAATFSYDSASNDSKGVTLSGGWNSGYTSQSSNPSLTVLDGGSDSRVLEIFSTSGVSITFTMENLTVQNGQTAGSGGGIYAHSGVSGNYGTINLTIDNCLIQDNDADGNGGGMYSTCYFEVGDSTFSNNAASNGGAMIIYKYPDGDQSLDPKIDNTAFNGNSNDGNQGGAIYNNVSPVITNCVFDGNTGYGSPIYCTSDSSLTISDSIFKNNDVYYWGSAIQFWDAGGNITNCLFYDNIAGNPGSGYAAVTHYDSMSGELDPIVVTNCTFCNNQSDSSGYGAIHNRGATFTIVNSIFWSNEGTAGIYNQYGTTTISYSDLQGGVPATCTDGGDNIMLNPQFDTVDLYHLTTNSPCIDEGNNTAANLPDEDIDGDARKIDGNRDGSKIVDMGVDEYDPYPYCDIKANGEDNSLIITKKDTLSLKIEINAKDFAGEQVDIWLMIKTNFPAPYNLLFYDMNLKTFRPGQQPSYQGPLGDIPQKEVFRDSGLKKGSYKIIFGIDYVKNGVPDLSQGVADIVKVKVN